MTTASSSIAQGPPPNLPGPPDAAKWDEAAQQFQQELLTKLQATAAVWSSAVSTLLGLFGTVALVSGSDALSELGDVMQIIVIVLIALAGVLAAASVALASQAQTLPDLRAENWSGTAYRVFVSRGARRAKDKLQKSRILGLAAAAVLFAVGLITLIDAAAS